ncbi:MAG: hypothetical protein ACYSW6_04885 [Planctomycetota bacterium]|jgi:hypothetical protein
MSTQDYFQLQKDAQLEKERMDEAFDSLSAENKKAIRSVARNLPIETEVRYGEPIKGLGHYGLLEILNKLALFDLASEATKSVNPDLSSAAIIRKAMEIVKRNGKN